MKRFTTLLLLAATSLALIFVLTACSNSSGGNFTAKTYSSSGKTIESVTINVLDREIDVSVSDDTQVHIDYFESEKEYYSISVSDDNVLKMEFLQDKQWTDFIGAKPAAEYRKINVKIPHSLLTNLTITSTNEPIKLSPLMVSDSISLSSNGGNIEFEKIYVGKALTISAKNGSINGTIIGSYDAFSIICEIKKGECNLPLKKADGEKLLKANCNNGDIKINFLKA